MSLRHAGLASAFKCCACPKRRVVLPPAPRYSRLKELQTKGNLTDKEKKELRRLKSEEMCEM